MKAKDLAAYLFLAFTWGVSFLVLVKVVHSFGWVGAVTFRCLVAGSALGIIAAMLRKKLQFGDRWHHFAIVGATTVAGQLIGLSFGTPLIGTAMAAILVASIPIFSMVMAQLWGLERATPRSMTGLLLGFAGIIMLVGFPSVPITHSFIIGCAACLLASLSAAFGSNYASLHLKGVGSFEVTMASFLAGGLMTMPLLFAVPVPVRPQALDYLFLLILGCGMSALTYVIYFRLVATIGATKTISVEFVVTLVAMVIGALLLGEHLSTLQLIGSVIIFCGCALALGLIPQRRAPALELDI